MEKKQVSTRYYETEQGYVQIQIDGETVHEYTLSEYLQLPEGAIWDALDEMYDLDELSDEIEFDPFTPDKVWDDDEEE